MVTGASVFGTESELRAVALKIERGRCHALAPEALTISERESAGWMAASGLVRTVRGKLVVTSRGSHWLGTFAFAKA